MEDKELLNRYSVTEALNKDFYSSLGLARGKMRAVIYFFHCARDSGDEYYEQIAGHLLDDIFEHLSVDTPLSFAHGLCGIGWGMEYLFQQGFVEGEPDDALAEIDSYIIHSIYLQEMEDLGLDNGILGLGCYILMRIRPTWVKGDTYRSIELKENLIYLIDWLDRKLDEAGSAQADILDWLSELRDTGFYKTKVEKMIAKLQK